MIIIGVLSPTDWTHPAGCPSFIKIHRVVGDKRALITNADICLRVRADWFSACHVAEVASWLETMSDKLQDWCKASAWAHLAHIGQSSSIWHMGARPSAILGVPPRHMINQRLICLLGYSVTWWAVQATVSGYYNIACTYRHENYEKVLLLVKITKEIGNGNKNCCFLGGYRCCLFNAKVKVLQEYYDV